MIKERIAELNKILPPKGEAVRARWLDVSCTQRVRRLAIKKRKKRTEEGKLEAGMKETFG